VSEGGAAPRISHDTWDGRSGRELAEAWGVPKVEALRTIGSTNDRAAELARLDSVRPLVVVAEEQTAGRGRRGADWQSASHAGVWMSIVLDAERAFPQLPLVVGVACALAIERTLGSSEARVLVKWPNDLLVADQKVGGILCESGPSGVIIGIGINVAVPPGGFRSDLAGRATALELVNHKTMARSALAASIIDGVLSRVDGSVPLDATWQELERRDALTGRAVETEEHGRGVARGIDPAGALRLELTDGQVRAVISGSVRLAATPGRG